MTEACQRCHSERVVSIQSHASDLHFVAAPHANYEKDGYLPYIENLGGGDDFSASICLQCGQVQGEWPVDDSAFSDEE